MYQRATIIRSLGEEFKVAKTRLAATDNTERIQGECNQESRHGRKLSSWQDVSEAEYGVKHKTL